MNLEEIKAREQAATPGPWINDVRVGCVAVYSGEKANCIDETEDRRLFFAKGKMVLDKDINFDHWETEPQDIKNAAFIAHARTDIPALIAEVERLTKEYREQDNAHHKLFMDFCDQQKQIATLKKAYELACEALSNTDSVNYPGVIRTCRPKSTNEYMNDYIHQAQQTHATQEAEK